MFGFDTRTEWPDALLKIILYAYTSRYYVPTIIERCSQALKQQTQVFFLSLNVVAEGSLIMSQK